MKHILDYGGKLECLEKTHVGFLSSYGKSCFVRMVTPFKVHEFVCLKSLWFCQLRAASPNKTQATQIFFKIKKRKSSEENFQNI